jgi:hypothetical protein
MVGRRQGLWLCAHKPLCKGSAMPSTSDKRCNLSSRGVCSLVDVGVMQGLTLLWRQRRMEVVEEAFACKHTTPLRGPCRGSIRLRFTVFHLTCGLRLGNFGGLTEGFPHALSDSRRGRVGESLETTRDAIASLSRSQIVHI